MTIYISIHAPRAGSDLSISKKTSPVKHFNPRSPGGERPVYDSYTFLVYGYFNPRSPGGERRCSLPIISISMLFQSTLPGRGATSLLSNSGTYQKSFNPRSPGGERLF